jgi:hypothetical protein
VRFIFDHSLPPRFSEILAILEGPAGNGVDHLRRFFPQDTEDPIWLLELAKRAPDAIVVTADPRISRGKHERAAWLESGLTVFFLRSFADLPGSEQAWRLVKWWPSIVQAARKARAGSGFLVTVNGKIEALR